MGVEGIGPSTSVLSGQRSTTELHAQTYIVPRQGLEPQFSRPERDVLPLDDLGASRNVYYTFR